MRARLIRIAAWLAFVPATFVSSSLCAKTYYVTITNLTFTPAEITVHTGDTVEWVNSDPFDHTATGRGKQFNIQLPKGAKGGVTLSQKGSIDYYCIFHPTMKGKITVQGK